MDRVILSIRLYVPKPKVPSMASDSWLLSIHTAYQDDKILVFGEHGQKQPGLEIFTGLNPKSNGHYDIELGVTLPDPYPNLHEAVEYTVEVKSSSGQTRKLAVSNQMVKMHFGKDGRNAHALMPLGLLDTTRTQEKVNHWEEAPFEYLKTTITSRFEIPGPTAEKALENCLWNCIDEFIELLNSFSLSMLIVKKGLLGNLMPLYDRNLLDCMYLAVKGESDEIGFGRIGLNTHRLKLLPGKLSEEDTEMLKHHLLKEKKFDDESVLVSLAKGYLDSGVLSFALLQLVIAGEVSTTRFVYERLETLKTVSKNKLGKLDLKYSIMLNICIPLLCPDDKKPRKEILDVLDRGRDYRNDLMHEGKIKFDRAFIESLYKATLEYVEYLKMIEDLEMPKA